MSRSIARTAVARIALGVSANAAFAQGQPVTAPASGPVVAWRPERPNEGELFTVRVEPPR